MCQRATPQVGHSSRRITQGSLHRHDQPGVGDDGDRRAAPLAGEIVEGGHGSRHQRLIGFPAVGSTAIGKMAGLHQRFWKFEHIGTMVVAIVLITLGRVLAKRAKEERRKQLLVGVFFLLALVLILWAIPWPFTEIGHGREWL